MRNDIFSGPDDDRLRVFVVDAHPLTREGVRHRIESEATFDLVGEASTAAEALVALERTPAAVVVLDHVACEAGDPAAGDCMGLLTAGARVVVLSHIAHPHFVWHALRSGARGYVLKRSPADRVIDAIRAVAGGGTFLDDGIAYQMLGLEEATDVLTAREHDVLQLIGQGIPSKLIARTLGISVRTVESHRQSLKRKLQIDGQAALIKYAVEHALPGQVSGVSPLSGIVRHTEPRFLAKRTAGTGQAL